MARMVAEAVMDDDATIEESGLPGSGADPSPHPTTDTATTNRSNRLDMKVVIPSVRRHAAPFGSRAVRITQSRRVRRSRQMLLIGTRTLSGSRCPGLVPAVSGPGEPGCLSAGSRGRMALVLGEEGCARKGAAIGSADHLETGRFRVG